MSRDAGEHETREARALVARLTGLALALYLAVGLSIGPDAALVGYGLEEQVHFAARRADRLDRDAAWGERPVLWIVGSSVAREAFDEGALADALPGWGVEKFAFDRGGPVFAWAFLDRLELRPGDRVVTTVSADHFRRGWLRYHDRPDLYLNFLLSPRQLLAISELPLADRLEMSVASAPPSAFWRWREPFRDGAWAWIEYGLGRRSRAPAQKERARHDPFQTRRVVPGFRELEVVERNAMTDAEMLLAPGQVNHDGLLWFVEAALSRGAEPWVVYVPENPEYAPRFLEPGTAERFHAHVQSAVPRYLRLSERPVDEYLDYKHPNFEGRAHFTAELARRLAESE